MVRRKPMDEHVRTQMGNSGHGPPWEITSFVFVALRPMSTAMVIAGRSVHLTTLFPGQA